MGRIGVLALQGGFSAHSTRLRELGHEAVEVRDPELLDHLDGLCLPGGESTTQLKLIRRFGFLEALARFQRSGRPLFVTCAGLILAAREVHNPDQESFGWLDIAVERNAWGRQVHSFEARSDDGRIPLVFIRAPRIDRCGEGVEVLATYRGEPIMVRQGNVVGATFHPELSEDPVVHERVFGQARLLEAAVDR